MAKNMDIIDIREELGGKATAYRPWSRIKGLMLHRCGIDLKWNNCLGYDAETICNAYMGRVGKWKEVARATNYQRPYTFIIGGDLGPQEHDGVIWQCLGLDEIGPHARRYSIPYIGIGLIGDFRTITPSEKQWVSTIKLCQYLKNKFYLGNKGIVAHGEIDGAHDGSKKFGEVNACPGDLFDMELLKAEL